MRKLLTFLIALASIVFAIFSPTQAQYVTLGGPFIGGPFIPGTPTLSGATVLTNPSCGFLATCQISASFTVPAGFIVAGAYVGNSPNVSITALSMCGVSQTPGITSGAAGASNASTTAMFYGSTSGGTCTGTVTVTGGSIVLGGIALVGVSNLTSTTPGTGCAGAYQPGTGVPYACTTGITVSAGGFGIAVFGDAFSGGTISSSNLTIDASLPGASITMAIGHTTTSNAPQFSDSVGSGFNSAAVAGAPWR